MALKEKILDRAQKFVQKGNFDKAIAEYKSAVDLDPRDVSIRLRIGDLYVKVGRKAEAIKEYMEVAKANSQRGFYLKAIAVYKQILKLDDTSIDIHYRLAELYIKQRLIADAISEYSFIMSSFERKGKMSDVMEILKKMVDADPENIGVRLKLADLYQRLSYEKDALSEYSQILDKLIKQGKFEKAEKIYLGLYTSNPREETVLTGLTQIYGKKGDDAQFLRFAKLLFHVYKDREDRGSAKAICESMLEVSPDDPDALRFLSQFKHRAEPEAVKAPPYIPEEPHKEPHAELSAAKSEPKETAGAPAERPLESWAHEEIEITIEGFEDVKPEAFEQPKEEPQLSVPETIEPADGAGEAGEVGIELPSLPEPEAEAEEGARLEPHAWVKEEAEREAEIEIPLEVQAPGEASEAVEEPAAPGIAEEKPAAEALPEEDLIAGGEGAAEEKDGEAPAEETLINIEIAGMTGGPEIRAEEGVEAPAEAKEEDVRGEALRAEAEAGLKEGSEEALPETAGPQGAKDVATEATGYSEAERIEEIPAGEEPLISIEIPEAGAEEPQKEVFAEPAAGAATGTGEEAGKEAVEAAAPAEMAEAAAKEAGPSATEAPESKEEPPLITIEIPEAQGPESMEALPDEPCHIEVKEEFPEKRIEIEEARAEAEAGFREERQEERAEAYEAAIEIEEVPAKEAAPGPEGDIPSLISLDSIEAKEEKGAEERASGPLPEERPAVEEEAGEAEAAIKEAPQAEEGVGIAFAPGFRDSDRAETKAVEPTEAREARGTEAGTEAGPEIEMEGSVSGPEEAHEEIREEERGIRFPEEAAVEAAASPEREEEISQEDLSEAITELMEKMGPEEGEAGPEVLEEGPEKEIIEPERMVAEPDKMIAEPERMVPEPEKIEEPPQEARKEDYVDLSAELGMEEALEDLSGPWREGESKETLDEFRNAMGKQLSKEDSETHYNLGIAYMEMELYNEASKEFKIALKDARLEFDCFIRLGLCAVAESNPDEAIVYYLKGLKLEGKTEEERKGIMYELALAYEAAGNNDEAIQLFRAIHKMDPGYREVSDILMEAETRGPLIPLDDGLIEVEIL